MPVNQQSEAAARLWLGGAAMQDIQALAGNAFAVEDAIRTRILAAANEEAPPKPPAVLTPKTSMARAISALESNPPAPNQKPPKPFLPAKVAERQPALDLTGYPAELQNPMAVNQRRVWDALKAADAPMDPRSILDAVSAHVTLETDDPEKLIVNALYLMKGKGLVERTEDRPARWKVVA